MNYYIFFKEYIFKKKYTNENNFQKIKLSVKYL